MMCLEVSPAHSYLLHLSEITFSLLGTSGGKRSASLWGYCFLCCKKNSTPPPSN